MNTTPQGLALFLPKRPARIAFLCLALVLGASGCKIDRGVEIYIKRSEPTKPVPHGISRDDALEFFEYVVDRLQLAEIEPVVEFADRAFYNASAPTGDPRGYFALTMVVHEDHVSIMIKIFGDSKELEELKVQTKALTEWLDQRNIHYEAHPRSTAFFAP